VIGALDSYGTGHDLVLVEYHRLCEDCGARVRKLCQSRCDGCLYGFTPSASVGEPPPYCFEVHVQSEYIGARRTEPAALELAVKVGGRVVAYRLP